MKSNYSFDFGINLCKPFFFEEWLDLYNEYGSAELVQKYTTSKPVPSVWTILFYLRNKRIQKSPTEKHPSIPKLEQKKLERAGLTSDTAYKWLRLGFTHLEILTWLRIVSGRGEFTVENLKLIKKYSEMSALDRKLFCS